MGKLRVLSGREVCAILARHGFVEARRRESHVIMQRFEPGRSTTVPVPDHRELRIGTLRSIIRQSEIPPPNLKNRLRKMNFMAGASNFGDVGKISSPLFAHHERTFENFRFVYPVLSRRSQGISIGVNLNPDKVCNFDCIYCQVDRTTAERNARSSKPTTAGRTGSRPAADSVRRDLSTPKSSTSRRRTCGG